MSIVSQKGEAADVKLIDWFVCISFGTLVATRAIDAELYADINIGIISFEMQSLQCLKIKHCLILLFD